MPDGGILGVHSLSDDPPLKSANFRARDDVFEDMSKYSDWKFAFTPALQALPSPPRPALGSQS